MESLKSDPLWDAWNCFFLNSVVQTQIQTILCLFNFSKTLLSESTRRPWNLQATSMVTGHQVKRKKLIKCSLQAPELRRGSGLDIYDPSSCFCVTNPLKPKAKEFLRQMSANCSDVYFLGCDVKCGTNELFCFVPFKHDVYRDLARTGMFQTYLLGRLHCTHEN